MTILTGASGVTVKMLKMMTRSIAERVLTTRETALMMVREIMTKT